MHLTAENHHGAGTARVRAGNPRMQPAFRDTATGKVYLSRHTDGRPAPCHLTVGLPDSLFLDTARRHVKPDVEAGFVCDGAFYTRAQAAGLATLLSCRVPDACVDNRSRRLLESRQFMRDLTIAIRRRD